MIENEVVLATVQALLGLVSPGLRGVAVEVDGDDITVHFAVSGVGDSLGEDADEVIADLEGLLWPQTPHVYKRVHVGSAGPGWEGRQHRLVLLAKG